MAPPPPPPPGAPPPPAPSGPISVAKTKGGKGDRKDLLKDIQKGARLKPTVTNDRSAPLVGKPVSESPAPTLGRGDGSSSQNMSPAGPLPGIGGLFAGGMPTLKKTKGGINTGRSADSVLSSNLHSAKPSIGSGNSSKYSYNSTSSSLNSSPSLSPSPSHVGSTPTHTKASSSAKSSGALPPPTNKPIVPSSKPTISPRPLTNSPGPIHPSSKPPPPPPNGNLAVTSLNRNIISKSFNQTIGHGPQGRPQLPNYGKHASKDDTSIRNGEIQAPTPPVRTVSQPQINPSRVPSRAPPPPPPSHKRPSQPPPPPPSHPPPPPGVLPPNKALPPPPLAYTAGDPPTPPTRRESIYRTGPASSGYNSSASSTGDSFESRFSSRFKAIQFLPPPEPFSGCQKTYPSKNTLPVRQGSQIKRTPAPPPPPGKIAPSTAPPPPPPCKTEVGVQQPGKPPLPPMRQWSTTASGML